MVLDLDRFKFINDSLGHRAGDELLNQVAQRLRDVVGKVDTVARIGGDEFVLVLGSVAERADAERVAQRAIESLKRRCGSRGVDLHISTSIGIAFYPADGTNAENLIAHADAAMYCAKQRGRNNLQFFEPGMDTATRDRVKLESDLHAALALGQFVLHYQPKVETATDYFHSAEALIRWQHPERGTIMPDDFIPLAEECGLINAIGEWVLREACRQCKAWQHEGLPPLRVAVNVSASQFRQGNLLAVIHERLERRRPRPALPGAGADRERRHDESGRIGDAFSAS